MIAAPRTAFLVATLFLAAAPVLAGEPYAFALENGNWIKARGDKLRIDYTRGGFGALDVNIDAGVKDEVTLGSRRALYGDLDVRTRIFVDAQDLKPGAITRVMFGVSTKSDSVSRRAYFLIREVGADTAGTPFDRVGGWIVQNGRDDHLTKRATSLYGSFVWVRVERVGGKVSVYQAEPPGKDPTIYNWGAVARFDVPTPEPLYVMLGASKFDGGEPTQSASLRVHFRELNVANRGGEVATRPRLKPIEELLPPKIDPPQKSGEREAERLNTEAAALVAQQRHAEAEALYRKATAANPRNATSWAGLSGALSFQKKYADAEKPMEEAVRLEPNNAVYQYNLGWVRSYIPKWKEAEVGYRASLALNSNNAMAQHGLGGALAGQGRWAEAEEAYRQAVRLDPASAEYLYRVGIAVGFQGKLAEAITNYKLALQVDPNFAVAHYAVGSAYSGQSKWAEAETAFRKAVSIEPTNAEYVYRVGTMLAAQQKFNEANAQYSLALQADPKFAPGYDGQGNIHFYFNRFAEAERAYRVAIQLAPLVGEYHANLAGALLKQDRRVEAMKSAREAKRLGFANHWSYPELGLVGGPGGGVRK